MIFYSKGIRVPVYNTNIDIKHTNVLECALRDLVQCEFCAGQKFHLCIVLHDCVWTKQHTRIQKSPLSSSVANGMYMHCTENPDRMATTGERPTSISYTKFWYRMSSPISSRSCS